MSPEGAAAPPTYFAPAERAAPDDIRLAREKLLSSELAVTLLNSVPDLAMVLNEQRQIIAVNGHVLRALGFERPEDLLGLRPGELVDCVHAADAPGGCGTGPSCSVCGAVNAILECLETRQPTVSECRVRTTADADGGALDLEVHATPLAIGELFLVILALRDISSSKRRQVLERTFFHDVLNIVSGLQAVSELMTYDDDPAAEEEYKRDMRRMAEQLADEIIVQRQLLAAERGELALNLTQAPVAGVLEAVGELYRNHTVARGRTLTIAEAPPAEIETDITLLRRVLGNLVKNALEASAEGETVTVRADDLGDRLAFSVHNPAAMPPDVQKQLFQRSFSTKGAPGRGIGTHSVKLLTEKYLGGRVTFVSREGEGTAFTVTVGKRHEALRT